MQNPSFVYANPGSYTVKLTVGNANGSNTKTKTGYISVTATAGPTADFSGTPTSGTAPLTVSFSDLSSGSPTSWAWDFDNNGVVDSTVQNPSFVYANPGSYTVKLTVGNANGSNTKTKIGYISVNTTGTTRIKDITFENGSLTDPTTGVDSISGSVAVVSGGQQLKGLYSARIPKRDFRLLAGELCRSRRHLCLVLHTGEQPARLSGANRDVFKRRHHGWQHSTHDPWAATAEER